MGDSIKSARRGVSAWLIPLAAAGAVCVGLGLVVWRGKAMPRPRVERPTAAAADTATIPDISTLSPQERFDRLYGRLIQALRAGDTATLARLAPMALGAYAMLDSSAVDSLTRHRAEVLRLHLSDTVPPVRTRVAP